MRPAGRTKPGGVGDTPYDAPHHYAARDAARRPTTARARQRRSQGLEIERVNAQLAKRLASVKRAPASTFHAPDGEASLRPKAQRGPKGPRAPPPWDATPARASPKTKASRGGSEGTDGSDDDGENAAKRSWPPPKPTGGAQRMRAEARRIREANATLRKALEEQYKPNRDSQLVAEGKGRPVDGLEMWKRRLAIYDDEDGEKKGTKKASDRLKGGRTKVEKGVCTSTGVPKAMGVARCSATGLYTYYAADGHKLKEHPDCPGLYYCEVGTDLGGTPRLTRRGDPSERVKRRGTSFHRSADPSPFASTLPR